MGVHLRVLFQLQHRHLHKPYSLYANAGIGTIEESRLRGPDRNLKLPPRDAFVLFKKKKPSHQRGCEKYICYPSIVCDANHTILQCVHSLTLGIGFSLFFFVIADCLFFFANPKQKSEYSCATYKIQFQISYFFRHVSFHFFRL